MTKYIYLAVITSLMGIAAFSIEIAGFMMSPFRALTIFLIIKMGIDLIQSKKSKLQKPQNFPYLLFMGIWFVYAILSVFWVRDYGGWFRGAYFIGLGTSYAFLMTHFLRNKYQFHEVMKIFPLMSIPHGLIGWFEIITGIYPFMPFNLSKLIHYRRYHYPVSTFGNTNDFALYLLFSIIILSIHLLLNNQSRRMQNIYLILTASNLGLLYFTNSRASILGLFLGIAVFAFQMMKFPRLKKILVRTAAAGAALFLILPSSVIEHFTGFNKAGLFSISASSDTRVILIRNGLAFLNDTFGFGVGAGNVEYWMEHNAPYNTNGIFPMHNWWFEILASYGIIIFVVYVVLYLMLMKKMAFSSTHSRDPIVREIALIILTLMCAYIIASTSSSSNMQTEWMWVFWGYAVAFEGILMSQGKDPARGSQDTSLSMVIRQTVQKVTDKFRNLTKK